MADKIPFIERDSEYYSNLAKQRKNPYLRFKDPKLAKEASLKGVEARKRKREESLPKSSQEA